MLPSKLMEKLVVQMLLGSEAISAREKVEFPSEGSLRGLDHPWSFCIDRFLKSALSNNTRPQYATCER